MQSIPEKSPYQLSCSAWGYPACALSGLELQFSSNLGRLPFVVALVKGLQS